MSASSPDLPNWIGHGLTAIGLVVSVGVVLLQLGRQHRSSLKLQRSNAREELKLRVYEALLIKARAFAEAAEEARAYADAIPRELETYDHQTRGGFQPSPVKRRTTRLVDLHYEAAGSLTDLMVEIENWEIAFPAAQLFRLALFSANNDVDETFQQFFEQALRFLPSDREGQEPYVPATPTPEQLQELQRTCKAYVTERDTLGTYSHDLVVEAQNLLLSKLFKRRVAIRQPIDPAWKVITASNTEDLMHYFQTETEAGKRWEEAKNRVRESVRQRGVEPLA